MSALMRHRHRPVIDVSIKSNMHHTQLHVRPTALTRNLPACGPPSLCQQHPGWSSSPSPRTSQACRADLPSNSGGAGDRGDKLDIDALARYLSKEAARLRDNINAGSRDDPANDASASRMLMPEDGDIERKLFEQVGEGGFQSVEFEIVQQLGSISMQQTGPQTLSGGRPSYPRTAVIAFIARFHPRLSYSQPVITLLKEYLPISRPVANNELLLLKHLCGLPDNKYAAASAPRRFGTTPVVPLLGYFLSCPSDIAADVSTDDSVDSIWLVYKWEGLRPLSLLMQEGPPQPAYGLLKSRDRAEEEAWALRRAILRAAASGLLAAVDFCHSADVVHGSLSSGSVLLGPWESITLKGREPLIVKLDGFGFGKWYSYSQGASGTAGAKGSTSSLFGHQQDDSTLEAGKRQDLQSVALLLAEAFICGMAPGTPRGLVEPGPARQQMNAQPQQDVPGAGAGLDRLSLQRLLFEVFHEDVQQFREYCEQDLPRYALLVNFLDEDEGAGWELLAQLLRGNSSALELSQHRFMGGGKVGSKKGSGFW